MEGYRFKSTLFDIEPGEDEQTNPRMYGRQLAAWLKVQLEGRGYVVEPVIDEDWGRCLVCLRAPFMLWVGCGSIVDYDTAKPGDPLPAKEDVIWHCFPEADVSLWKRLFRRIDPTVAVAELDGDLRAILVGESRITLMDV